jgi:hypothetical protein
MQEQRLRLLNIAVQPRPEISIEAGNMKVKISVKHA